MIIYKLLHFSNNKIYIGKTTNQRKRFLDHLNQSKKRKTPVHLWIQELLVNNLKPTMETIEECTEGEWKQRERYWIDHYRSKLGRECVLNILDGGDNPPAYGHPISMATRKKISKSLKGIKRPYLTNRHRIKLTQKDVEEIFRLHQSGMSNRKISKLFNVCHQHVGEILKKPSPQT